MSNFYNKCCNLPKVTGVTSNKNVVSVVGKDLEIDTKNKIIETRYQYKHKSRTMFIYITVV